MKIQGVPAAGLMGRSNNFDALRVLLALMVLYSHCFHLVERTGKWFNPLEFTRGQSFLGGIAVDGFFLISGFLITASWMRSRGIVDYLRRRILRIFPGFVVAALLCLLVVGPWAAPSVAGYFGQVDLVKRLIGVATSSKMEGLPTFLNNPVKGDVNGSLWTIRIEFECYLLVPILGWLGFLRRPPMMVALAAAAYALHTLMALAPGIFPGKLMRLDDHVRFGTY
ncbi:MAG: acyltransferase family protein, partial [Armatimonadaceae bacterium]